MVLYYKKIETVEPEPFDTHAEQDHKIETKFRGENRTPSNQELINEIYKTPFSDRVELYYSLMEDNFNNLSTDDKLVMMYKTSIIRSNTTNNYILMCLTVLLIIALKIYSK